MQSMRHFVMSVFVALVLILLQTGTTSADRVSVHCPEGTTHGVFSVKSLNGKKIGKGDLIETVDGRRVSAKLTLNFDDGSLYKETTHFTQDGVFRLLDYHMLQRGPSFKEALEMTIDTAKGVVIVSCSGGQEGDCDKDAPNNPAKLLGFRASPIRANTETTMPSITNRKRSCISGLLARSSVSLRLSGAILQPRRNVARSGKH